VAFQKFLADNRIPLAFDSLPARRILAVDDEQSVGAAFEAALKAKGYEVVVARSGREALRSIRQEHFDLIFLGVLLPPPSGASILRAIKRLDPEAVVVLVTGYPDHEETLAALQHGPAMLLPKPVKVSDIYSVLKIVFQEQIADQPSLRDQGEAARGKSPIAWGTRGARR
jgi:DNA-binding NtrC family response regulator